jgi:signal peptidase I
MTRIVMLILLAMTVPAMAQDMCMCTQCIGGAMDRYSMTARGMKPNIEVGQCVIAQMIAAAPATPQPGDLIIFRHPVSNLDHIFRLIAVAGDTVQMQDGRLILNGTPVQTTPLPPYHQTTEGPSALSSIAPCPDGITGQVCDIPQFRETLPNGASYAVIDLRRDSDGDTTDVLTVPADHVFVLGDNRDVGFDSRYGTDIGGPGFVPIANIRGIVREIRPLP